ncbi:unnamed protein product [Ectocarpus fasciculatus]
MHHVKIPLCFFPLYFCHVYTPSPGIVPNASTGEFAHQQHQRTNKSSCGRNASQHYITRANTNYAWAALADGVRYNVMKYDYRKRGHVEGRPYSR